MRKTFLYSVGALTLASVLSLTSPVLAESKSVKTAGTQKNHSETYKQLNLFGDVFERVRAEYVEEIEDEKLIEYSLNGMLTSLDPHSDYLNKDDLKNMNVQTRGEFGGLGIEVTMDNGLVKVVSPIDDTPAFRAGMKAGDLISKIDDEQVMGMSLSDAVKKMRGKVGAPIELIVLRQGEDKPLTIKIIRDIIKIKSVRHRVEGNIGYLRITTFNQQTFKGLKKSIKEIKAELGDKLTGYVLDLRNNPGGLLSQAIYVSDAFLEKGEIVSTRGRAKDDIRRDNATSGDLTDGLPIVVLVNGGSASASEIVAGALQDHKRGIIMGEQSFGKGSVQTIITVPGHGAIRLTTARYYTPSGRSIQGKGITPDIVVDPAKIVEKLDTSYAIREADLRGALDVKKKDKKKSKKGKNSGKKSGKKGDGKDKKETNDYQLTRALDLLQGIALYNKTLK